MGLRELKLTGAVLFCFFFASTRAASDACGSIECSNNGVYNTTSKTCTCTKPWTGPQCSTLDTSITGMQCNQQGICECAGSTPVLDLDSKQCRRREEKDCTESEPVFNATTEVCREREAKDCTGDQPVFVPQSKTCRSLQASDCTGKKPVFVSSSKTCRARQASDCAGTSKPLFNATTEACREREAKDCTGDQPVFVPQSKTCRSLQASDCTGKKPVFVSSSKTCRARQASDCAGTSKPVFDSGTGECQASESCLLDATAFLHAGGVGTCDTTELQPGTSCVPTCDPGLSATGSVTCEKGKPLKITFQCNVEFEMEVAGISEASWKNDEDISKAFVDSVTEVLPDDVNADDIYDVSMNTDNRVVFKIRVFKNGPTEQNLQDVMASAISDGTFTSTMQRQLVSSSVASINASDVAAKNIQVVVPIQPESGDKSDSGQHKKPGSSPVGAIVGALVGAIAIVALVFYVKRMQEKRNKGGSSELPDSNELTLEKHQTENPLDSNEGYAANSLESGPAVAVFVTDK